MNVVAWALVAFGVLFGVLQLGLSSRRTVWSVTITDAQRSGIAMPAGAEERTREFFAAGWQWSGLFTSAATVLIVLVNVTLTTALGPSITAGVGGFLLAASLPAGSIFGVARDARRRLATPGLSRDLRTLGLRDFRSPRARVVHRVSGLITIAAWGIVSVSLAQTAGLPDIDRIFAQWSITLFIFMTVTVIGQEVLERRTASLPVAASNQAGLAWEDAMRFSLLQRGIIATISPASLILVVGLSFGLPTGWDLPALVFAAIGLCFYAAVGIYTFVNRRREPYMLTRLWPEVAATRAARRTPALPEVVAP